MGATLRGGTVLRRSSVMGSSYHTGPGLSPEKSPEAHLFQAAAVWYNPRMKIQQDSHPLLFCKATEYRLAKPLGKLDSTDLFGRWKREEIEVPFTVDRDFIKGTVRSLLRVGGFKPAGRSKPASEYLIKAYEGGFISSINAAVDVCNVVSYHSGLPISVVDADRLEGALRLRHCPPDTNVIFNLSGQELRMDGLISLWDEKGPSACAVKDSQRTKTGAETTRVLTLVWGSHDLDGLTEETAGWFERLMEPFTESLQRLDVTVES